MNYIISVMLIIVMMFSNFFNSFNGKAADLSEGYNESSVQLSDSDKALLKSIVISETQWLASLQLSNGAFPMYDIDNGEVSLNPYFADFAAMALLDVPEKYTDNVKKYLEWHFSHLNTKDDDYNRVDGTIYDYTAIIKDSELVSENITEKDGLKSYDSTDSYAATFLTLLKKYYDKTKDDDYIVSNSDNILRISEAMLSTLHKGLTFAKPDYEVKYLMDNCEVYEGINSAIFLLKDVLGVSNCNLTYNKLKNASELLFSSIEKNLWNYDDYHYESGIFRNGDVINDFSWGEFYPCATSQLFTIIHNVIPASSERAVKLYDRFCEEYNWESFDIPSEYCWGSNVLASAKLGDVERVLVYMKNFIEFSSSRVYPLYNADAARVSMAADILLDLA